MFDVETLSSYLFDLPTYFFEKFAIWYVYVVNSKGGNSVAESFGSRLRSLRKKKNMKQEEVAKALSIGRSTYSNYENDVHSPDNETLSKMAQLFGTSTDYLLLNELQDPPFSKVNEGQSTSQVSAELAKWQNLAEVLAKALQMHEETSRIREENERLRIEKVDAVAQSNLKRVIDKIEKLSGIDGTDKEATRVESKSLVNE